MFNIMYNRTGVSIIPVSYSDDGAGGYAEIEGAAETASYKMRVWSITSYQRVLLQKRYGLDDKADIVNFVGQPSAYLRSGHERKILHVSATERYQVYGIREHFDLGGRLDHVSGVAMRMVVPT